MFGRHAENEMNLAEERTKSAKNKGSARQQALTSILNAQPETEQGVTNPYAKDSPPAEPKKFRDPAIMFKK